MATTPGAPAPPAVTITASADQLYAETTRKLAQALSRFGFGRELVHCNECLEFWPVRGATLGDVVSQALAHECPPARHLSPVSDSPAG